MSLELRTVDDAYTMLQRLGASHQLICHVKLVGEAAEGLLAKLQQLQMPVDECFVRLGVAFHDAGKILHSEELVAKGTHHEAAGEQLLIANGVDPSLARCCRSHGQWQTMDCCFEELLVALADALWKGKRDVLLEGEVVQRIATLGQKEYWALFVEMDSCFEAIAADGHSRLLRSQI
jgi:HD domain